MKNNDRNASLAIYLFKKRSKKTILKIITTVLILGLCFTIILPLLNLVPVVLSSIEELGNPNVIWLPLEKSLVSFKAAIRFILPNGLMTMAKSVLYATGIMVIQIFFSAMVGYSLARINFWGRNVVFFMVILVFLLPRQSLLFS